MINLVWQEKALRLTNAVERYDTVNEFWVDVKADGDEGHTFPPISGFALVRIPRNFTRFDVNGSCNCVPDQNRGGCFDLTEKEEDGSGGAIWPSQLFTTVLVYSLTCRV